MCLEHSGTHRNRSMIVEGQSYDISANMSSHYPGLLADCTLTKSVRCCKLQLLLGSCKLLWTFARTVCIFVLEHKTVEFVKEKISAK